MTKCGMWKTEGQGHDSKAKRLRVNKPGILWEKQSQGNMGYFDGDFFQTKQNKC